MKTIEIGKSYTTEALVEEHLLAKFVGSGDVAVYATPMMIALMEGAAVACLGQLLDEGETSVGVQLSTTHLAATPCSMKVSATATITATEGRKVSFSITARDEKELIGEATHERFVVLKEKFEARANEKRKA